MDHGPAPDRLWYRRPAASFLEALPLGNGRLGAMLYGGPGQEGAAGETVQLRHVHGRAAQWHR